MRGVERLVQPGTATAPAEDLADLGIRYVILHKLCLEEADLDGQTSFLSDRLGDAVYDDRWIRAFEVPGQPEIGPRGTSRWAIRSALAGEDGG